MASPCGSILVGQLSVSLCVWCKKKEKGNRAVKIVKFTVNLNLHLNQVTVSLNVIDACQAAHVPKGT
jgi:hypothetical protein